MASRWIWHKGWAAAWRLGMLAAVLVLSLATEVRATPVTFRFEAEISQVQGNVAAIILPFPLVIGQKFKGQYEFQSEQNMLDLFLHPSSTEALVRLSIAGTELETATNSGTLNDGGPVDIINPPPPGPKSSLSLRYNSLTDVFPGWGGYFAGYPFGVSLALVGPDGIVNTPEDVLDVDVWNQLNTQRRLDFQLGYFVLGELNIVNVRATIGVFFIVPEPSSMVQVCGLLTIGLAYFFSRRQKGTGPFSLFTAAPLR